MSGQNLPKPTDAELSILSVLWKRGPSTVRQVQEKLSQTKPTGYTTVLKLLQIMTGKMLVLRDESKRTHVYRAKHEEADMQQRLADDLIARAFGGSKMHLVNALFNNDELTKEEFEKLRRQIVDLRREES